MGSLDVRVGSSYGNTLTHKLISNTGTGMVASETSWKYLYVPTRQQLTSYGLSSILCIRRALFGTFAAMNTIDIKTRQNTMSFKMRVHVVSVTLF